MVFTQMVELQWRVQRGAQQVRAPLPLKFDRLCSPPPILYEKNKAQIAQESIKNLKASRALRGPCLDPCRKGLRFRAQ